MRTLIACLFSVIALSADLLAQEPLAASDLTSLDFEDLLNVRLVTASKVVEAVRDIPASVVVITREDIESQGYQSIEALLQHVPGLYLMDDYVWTGTKNYGVRGFFSTGAFNDMVVMINGVCQRTDALYDSYPTEKIAVPIEAVERVEVIRGPMSVIYGSGAFLGAINIITLPEVVREVGQRTAVSLGTGGQTRAYAGLQRQFSQGRFHGYASYTHDGGVDVPFSTLMPDPEIVEVPFEEGGWNLNTSRTRGLLETQNQCFGFDGVYQNWDFHFRTVGSEKETVESFFGAGGGNTVHYAATTLSTGYSQQWSDKWSVKGQLNYSHDHHWVDNELFFKHSYTNNWARMHVFQGNVDASWNPNDSWRLIGGLQLRRMFDFCVVADYPYFQFADVEIDIDAVQSQAAYIQADWQALPGLTLVSGIRAEALSPYGITVSTPVYDEAGNLTAPFVSLYDFKPAHAVEWIPRFAAIWAPGSRHVLKVMGGQAIKQPSANANLDKVFSGGPVLRPALMRTLELNYIGNVLSRVTLDLSLFRNRVADLISRYNYLDPELGLVISSRNAGAMEILGLELGCRYQPVDAFDLVLSTTLQESKNRREGFESIEPGYSPRHLSTVMARFQLNHNCSLALSAFHVSEMEAGWDMNNLDGSNRPVVPDGHPYGGRFGRKAPGYLDVGAHLRVQDLWGSGWWLALHGQNLLDDDIVYPATASNPQLSYGTRGQGRRFNVTVGRNW